MPGSPGSRRRKTFVSIFKCADCLTYWQEGNKTGFINRAVCQKCLKWQYSHRVISPFLYTQTCQANSCHNTLTLYILQIFMESYYYWSRNQAYLRATENRAQYSKPTWILKWHKMFAVHRNINKICVISRVAKIIANFYWMQVDLFGLWIFDNFLSLSVVYQL